MSTSVRSYLVAGAAAATATAIALTPVQAAPADIAVPAHPTSAEPQLTQAMIDLLAAASRMTAAVTPKLPSESGAAPALGVAPAAAATGVTAAPTAIAIAPNLANTIDQVYVTVEPWVQWGFEVGAAALGWVPWVGGWAGGLLMDAYNFGQSLIASGVFNFTDWLRGDGGIIQNLADFGVDAVLAVAWLGIDVVNTFIPLPPIPLPPRPPLQGPFLASTLATPTAALDGAAQNPLTAVTDAITKARDDFATAFKSLTGGTSLATLADRLKVQAAAGEDGPVTELVGSTVEKAVEGAIDTTKEASENLANGLNETVKAVSNDAEPQKLTTAKQDDVSVVPKSIRQALRNADDTTAVDNTETTDTTLGRSVRQGVREAAGKTAAGVKKAGDDTRDAVKNAVRNLTPKTKTTPKATPKAKDSQQSKDSTDSGKSDNAKNDKK
ncbi:hypothetical protein PUR22_02455 [Mycolicibacterium porcinum]|uniref:hypothetical protein n=1 Tax=Mycolicibacterium porcinum TaxID=39693 RepID=UPI0031F83E3D